MKKYAYGLYAVEVSRDELKKAIEKRSAGTAVESVLDGFILNDPDPDCEFSFDTPEAASANHNPCAEIETFKSYAGTNYIRLSRNYVEEYEGDEDGEYLYGGNFDGIGEFTEEQIKDLLEYLGIEQ